MWEPSPNYWPSRMGYRPKWVILHSSAGGGSVAWLRNPDSGVSSHYDITQDGGIHQLVSEDAAAWGNGIPEAGADPWFRTGVNPNLETISIEHEKPDETNGIPLTAAQAIASFQLIARICQRWNIPMRQADANGGITGHFSIDPVDRAHCPGTYPWAGLWAYLKQVNQPAPTTNNGDLKMLTTSDPMGQFFTEDGAVWRMKKNNIVLHGLHLDFYRKHEGIFGLPLTNELNLASMPNTAIVVYERAIACYDPAHKFDNPPGSGMVYLMHLEGGTGRDIVAKPLVTELNKQISQLNDRIKTLENQTAPAELDALRKQAASYKAALDAVYAAIKPLEAK